MVYEELYNDFLKKFPDDVEFFRNLEEESGADVNDGIHVVFAMIIVPFVNKIVKENPEKARKAFDFFEEMEKSEDPKIAEVLEFTVLEKLLTENRAEIAIYEKYFGEETKKAALAVGKWFK